jgi:hypothetical protein
MDCICAWYKDLNLDLNLEPKEVCVDKPKRIQISIATFVTRCWWCVLCLKQIPGDDKTKKSLRCL